MTTTNDHMTWLIESGISGTKSLTEFLKHDPYSGKGPSLLLRAMALEHILILSNKQNDAFAMGLLTTWKRISSTWVNSLCTDLRKLRQFISPGYVHFFRQQAWFEMEAQGLFTDHELSIAKDMSLDYVNRMVALYCSIKSIDEVELDRRLQSKELTFSMVAAVLTEQVRGSDAAALVSAVYGLMKVCQSELDTGICETVQAEPKPSLLQLIEMNPVDGVEARDIASDLQKSRGSVRLKDYSYTWLKEHWSKLLVPAGESGHFVSSYLKEQWGILISNKTVSNYQASGIFK